MKSTTSATTATTTTTTTTAARTKLLFLWFTLCQTVIPTAQGFTLGFPALVATSRARTISKHPPAAVTLPGLQMSQVDSFLAESHQVVVSIRYSAEADMVPYYQTVAKKIRQAHPDVLLNPVVLPKQPLSDLTSSASTTPSVYYRTTGSRASASSKPSSTSKSNHNHNHNQNSSHNNNKSKNNNSMQRRPTFEVTVDGKKILPSVGRKELETTTGGSIFVSMQELDGAIARARRRRRNIYGEQPQQPQQPQQHPTMTSEHEQHQQQRKSSRGAFSASAMKKRHFRTFAEAMA